MKITSVIIILIITVSAFGQIPQKVYSVVKERRDLNWYQEQEGLWEKEIEKNAKNADAYYNYFQAVRAQLFSGIDQEQKDKVYDKLDQLNEDIKKNISGSFEYYLIMHKNDGFRHGNNYKYEYLEKAYEIDPLDPRTYVLLLTHHYIERNKAEYKLFCQKYYEANELAPFVYNLGYNFLSELDSNAILLTAGDNDTYPAMILQEVMGYRTDVTILNTSLLQIDEYRDKIFKEIGLPEFEPRMQEVESNEGLMSTFKLLQEHILKNKIGKPVYVAVTGIRQFKEDFEDNLYITGVTFKYSEESIDNIALLKRNYEKRMQLDRTWCLYSYHIQNSKLSEVNSIYVPGLIKLYKHYRDSENLEKIEELKTLLVQLSKGNNQQSEIEKLIKE